MKVAKWGNSLAVRLPAKVVATLGLAEGDEVALTITPENRVQLRRVGTREEAIERIRELQIALPRDYKFDREEAHARGKDVP